MKAFRRIWLLPSLHSRQLLAQLQRPLTVDQDSTRFSPTQYFLSSASMGGVTSQQTFPSPIDLLSMDASELQACLTQKKLTSVQLVRAELEQIRKQDHNGLNLHSMISTAPEEDVLKIAAELDRERAEGCIRGPLHGITIIVKVWSPNLHSIITELFVNFS
jgi:hypothetical protein